MKLRQTSKEYQEYFHSTKKPMSWEQWQRIEIDKKTSQENFPSHNPPKKTLWDKIRKDPVFARTLEKRIKMDDDTILSDNPTMGNRKR